MEIEERLDIALRHLFGGRVSYSDLRLYLRQEFIDIPSDFLKDREIEFLVGVLKDDGCVLETDEGHIYYYSINQYGRDKIFKGGYVLENYRENIKGKMDKLPNPDSLLFEFDKEVALVKAQAKDVILTYVNQFGDNALYSDFEVALRNQNFSSEWRGELFDNYLLQDFMDGVICKVRITDRGNKLLKEGGFTRLINNYFSKISRQEDLKVKEAQTIEYNHKLSKSNWENYNWDRGKFYIPIIISCLAIAVAFYSKDKSDRAVVLINKTNNPISIDSLAIINSEHKTH